ncbi:nitric oxide dioxygenase [Snodgrassella communis]|uniref:Flavohemoprotein n=1 Tax=Snodgrassella communis TaxID=2946699 RepID=A0A066TDU8_9NEIS|nr:NO-inducible flavohemoprotein [Snodgrassella communis]KDN13055.1 Flavohemoprotein (Hemoglobin-like protein) (Flavohemoglobin) (Nitric oxide dioxygenase) [Snodgrassella communis]KDN13993.1 Flavohemoprotein (Hemoglobin-like protein) (Flavohemoglobin) (Nitric oxide dioxygenase) [Snodgrassella communis]PIT09303.1 nitric oxide dioxygenase [Snodgrassella communis]PIT28765.1 nitric oxide dioxygenase [Snodgrassella communis]PIT30462.1 nitric oxide dioxygenase [Snodgrassella communis]
MQLTARQIELVQATIPTLQQHGVELTRYFYNRMLSNSPELKEIFNLGNQRNDAQPQALANAILAYAQNITTLHNLSNAITQIAHRHVSLNIQPEQYPIVGTNLLHSISEVLNVPMDSELIAAWRAAYQQLADILIQAETNLYQQQDSTKGGWKGWKKFKIVDKREESSEITSFYLQPVDNSPLPEYQPGQYISVRVLVPQLGIRQPRQYSLSDSNHVDYFRISVKKEAADQQHDAGYVSTTLHEHYHIGDEIEVTNPTGTFLLHNPDKNTVLISAGVGITPMIAILNTLAAKNNPYQQISFIHACRNSNVLAMHQHIITLQQTMPNLRSYLACENPDTQLVPDKIGRLELSELDSTLLPADADYYICGPKQFMHSQYQALLNLSIPQNQIFMELFGTGTFCQLAA